MNFETTILKSLIENPDYCKKVLPFIKEAYFFNPADKEIFQTIWEHTNKYGSPPTVDGLRLTFQNKSGLKQSTFDECTSQLDEIAKPISPLNSQWLLDKTEEFCQEKAIYNAMQDSIEILNNKGGKKTKGAIPQILSDALAISFDPNIGHDYLEDAQLRFDFYHNITERVPFDLEFFNKITNGGFPKKSLSIVMAGIHAGKSLFMNHCASFCLTQGKNVLYITLEMSEEAISQRIDANLLNITLTDLMTIPEDEYIKRINKLKAKTTGKLIVKEYPTTSGSVLHFKALLNELFLKKGFVPDIIFVDYINICASARYTTGNNVSSYERIKAIAEELRGLAFEVNLPIVSATQVTRQGFNSSDPDMTDVAESFGLPATADFLVVMTRTEEMDKLNQVMFTQLKNRFSDFNTNKRFAVGIDTNKFRLYDVAPSAQKALVDTKQNMTHNKPELPSRNNSERAQKFKELII